jgi:glycosyltransferase involved in cell wall biosynthesis
VYGPRTVGVVLPAYNEEAGISVAVRDFLAQDPVDKVYVVDNNSTDRTAKLAQEAGGILISEPNQGYGWALRRGLKEADTDYVALCEPDGTFLARDIYKLLAYSEDFSMVMGTRTTRELIWRQANMGWFLRFGNYLLAKLTMFLFNAPSLSDCGCTFRLIDREAVKRMNPYMTVGGSHFLPEMVCLALLMGIPIIEVPINYCGRVGRSKITGHWKGTITTSVRMLYLVLSYRVRAAFGLRRRLRQGSPVHLASGSTNEAPRGRASRGR